MLHSKCHRGDHLFYSSKPCGGCWHQHGPACGVLPTAPPILSRVRREAFWPLSLLNSFWQLCSLEWCGPSRRTECLPGGNLFGITILFICALLGGKLVALIRLPKLPPFPPLLGMLLMGFLLRNIPVITDGVYIDYRWSASLRNIALAVILARAGLGLDPTALKKLKAVCIRVAAGPCIIETCTTALISHFLMGLPWVWGFILGFVLGAVSPAVVVPSMLLLQKDGYGVEQGIPTLLMAAGSFDDILAITGFTTCLGMAFATGSTWYNLLRGVLEVGGGMVIGILLGFIIQYFPSVDQKHIVMKRSFLVLGMSVFAVFGSGVAGFPWLRRPLHPGVGIPGWSRLGNRQGTRGRSGGMGVGHLSASAIRTHRGRDTSLRVGGTHSWFGHSLSAHCPHGSNPVHLRLCVVRGLQHEGEGVHRPSVDAQSHSAGSYWLHSFRHGQNKGGQAAAEVRHGCADRGCPVHPSHGSCRSSYHRAHWTSPSPKTKELSLWHGSGGRRRRRNSHHLREHALTPCVFVKRARTF
ncbi:Sodium/hydrogen exchanger 9B2 [Larimichthys crocea]|uniref:Uncharacterized protein n=1 Tax=Larimichthys crocea TaxID=215358 RepID=A0ACD3RVA8_LARCR|nr:Sodium/hydrogen exchanger 9B2 [Larimichthys crocea]